MLGDQSIVKSLINFGANLNQSIISQQDKNFTLNGWTPLHFATVTQNAYLAQLLLHFGAKVESPEMVSETPLQLASMLGGYTVVHIVYCRYMIFVRKHHF